METQSVSSNEKREEHLLLNLNRISEEVLEKSNDKKLLVKISKKGIEAVEGGEVGRRFEVLFYYNKMFFSKEIKTSINLSVDFGSGYDYILKNIVINYYDKDNFQEFRNILMEKLQKYHAGLKDVKLKEIKHF